MTDEEKKAENARKAEEYKKLTEHYKTKADQSFRKLTPFAICALVVILVLAVSDRFLVPALLTGTQYFFLFISLVAFSVFFLLRWQYQNHLEDPLSDFSENPSLLLAANKSFDKRIAANRKFISDNISAFWTGVFSLALLMLLWLIFPVKNKAACAKESSPGQQNKGLITIDLLQINDVYEIAPLDSERIGGMARIATLKKQLLAKNTNTMLLVAGDFLSPSVFNSVKQDNEKVAGRQMIDAMNTAGVDLAIFGNHEFDVKYNVLQKRMNESRFQWVASNVHHKKTSGEHERFTKNASEIPETYTKTFVNADGDSFTLGFFGITLPDNKGDSDYAAYDNSLVIARKMYERLAPECDAVIAVTHQDVKDDSILAVQLPQLAAIIGGHEHDMQFMKVGNVYITKAHSNAKSAFHLKLTINRNTEPKVTVDPELIPIDTSIPQDYLTKTIVDRWMAVAMDYFINAGFAPDSVMCPKFKGKLDGRDAGIRSRQTNLTKLITDAMLDAGKTKGCTVSVLNAGSIRVDDIISPPVTQYSILRALPYEGKIYIAKMKGWLIKTLIDSASHLKNDGAFLQYSTSGNGFDTSTEYTVAIGDYLISGKQKKLEFLNPMAKGIRSVDSTTCITEPTYADMRKAVISYLEKNRNNPSVLRKYE